MEDVSLDFLLPLIEPGDEGGAGGGVELRLSSRVWLVPSTPSSSSDLTHSLLASHSSICIYH